ncbi:hypothetical protein KKC1_08780 [Calderihabitans maritimus]|uniref:Uncharacterized protein n=1 Tax=Calderihabitans maritimus TaxID=1246530 RepID=A0A1Z5HQR5_9FIRM|nr:hypothetical protein KKC1_08780 [Calderihabitans maritimus]
MMAKSAATGRGFSVMAARSDECCLKIGCLLCLFGLEGQSGKLRLALRKMMHGG